EGDTTYLWHWYQMTDLSHVYQQIVAITDESYFRPCDMGKRKLKTESLEPIIFDITKPVLSTSGGNNYIDFDIKVSDPNWTSSNRTYLDKITSMHLICNSNLFGSDPALITDVSFPNIVYTLTSKTRIAANKEDLVFANSGIGNLRLEVTTNPQVFCHIKMQ